LTKSKEESSNFNRIVYFDESSATDLVYMVNKGQILKEIESVKGNKVEANSDFNAEIGTSFNFLNWFKSKISVDGGIALGTSSEKLISQVINNTTLTDYLDLPLENCGIEVFKNVVVYPYPNSLTYFKLLTPYMTMTEGSLDAGELKINANLMDSAIEKGKGYFELIALKKDKTIILRFNLSSFKNSYSLADLVKMKLTYHAIEVGEMRIEKLNIDSEFKIDEGDKNIDGYLLAKEESSSEKDFVKVFDVILAGVSHD
jgi:hypothetical protein